MIEIRIHGRGGQGGVTLAKILATSRFLMGDSVQAFGLYAAERSGAPVQAFCRFSETPITNRNIIYEPDHIMVLDPTLIGSNLAAGLKPGGWILLNTAEGPEQFASQFPANRIATVDATSIARDNQLGTKSVPIVNTALAGAASHVLEMKLPAMLDAFAHLGFGGSNRVAAQQAYDSVHLQHRSRPGVAAQPPPPAPSPPAPPPASQRIPSIVDGGGGAKPKIRTGQWASQQPRRRQMIPPCNHVCPAGNDVQGFLQALAREQTDLALDILLRTNPFPSICGRVCPAPCMAQCNRIPLGGAVNVRELERLAGDQGDVTVEPDLSRDLHVAIIGSGPAGLSAAYQLARLGYQVTIFEAGSELGGLLQTGIPGFRLPQDVVQREIGRILALGVEVQTGTRVDRAALLHITRQNDALLVATGLQETRNLRLGIGDSRAVCQGIEFLDQTRQGHLRVDGEQVIVIGGGNTAMDAARSALRLGAASVKVVYRREQRQMPAIPEEIEEACEEGVEMEFLAQPISICEGHHGSSDRPECDGPECDGPECDGPECTVTFRRVQPAERDPSGQSRPVELPGTDFELTCHRLILALGQSPDMSVFPEGTEVREGDNLLGLTETPVFAIGDLATNDGTVAGAIGSGRRAALHIHEVLTGEPADVMAGHPSARSDVDQYVDQVVRPESMKLHLFEKHRTRMAETIPLSDRRSTFHEVHMGLPDASEAKACLSCGVCNECDICQTYCPEGVLKRVGHRFVFDYAFCKGCGVCVTECPRNVIFMSHL